MAKNKASKPRNKKYVPKYQDKIPVLFKFTEKELEELRIMTQGAIFALTSGRGNMEAWRDILWRLAVGREMAIKYFKEDEACSMFHEAIRHAIRIYQAHEGKPNEAWVISAEDAQRFQEACDLADTMIPQLTRREYTQAYEPLSNMPISVFATQDVSWEEYKAVRLTGLKVEPA